MRTDRVRAGVMVVALAAGCSNEGDLAVDTDPGTSTGVETSDANTTSGPDLDTDTDPADETDGDGDGQTVADGDCVDDDPRITGSPDRFVEVSVSQNTACALDSAGAIHCWGVTRPWDEFLTEPFGDTCHRDIATGGGWGWVDFVCALDSARRPVCWGLTSPDDPQPALVGVPKEPFASIVAGGDFACGLDAEGSASCWGGSDDFNGNLGTKNATSGLTSSGPYTQISAGWETACGVLADGGVNCFGANRYGEVSDVPSGSFAEVHAFGLSVCAMDTDGVTQCWGQLNEWDDASPLQGVADVVNATGDLYGACLQHADGVASCVGLYSSPGGTYEQIDGGLAAACGVRDDGSLRCWGGVNEMLEDPPELP